MPPAMPSARHSAATRAGAALHIATIRSTIVITLFNGRLEVRQTLHVRLAIADFGIAGLAIKAARGGIEIDGGALDFAQGVDALRAGIHERQYAARPGVVEWAVPPDVAERIQIVIDKAAGDVARHCRPGQGKDEIGTFAHAIDSQRLTEILLVVGHSPIRRDVEDADKTEGRIGREATDRFAAAFKITLQHVVRER